MLGLVPIQKRAAADRDKAFLSNDHLIYKDKTYTVDTNHQLPNHLQPEEIFTKKTSTHTAFFSKYSPLSNFHIGKFKDQGIIFTSNEQRFHWSKAIHSADDVTAQAILQTDDPAQCKRLGDRVKIHDQKFWDEIAQQIMYEGCLAKFSQSAYLKNILLDTKNAIIIEANARDKVWGGGVFALMILIC